MFRIKAMVYATAAAFAVLLNVVPSVAVASPGVILAPDRQVAGSTIRPCTQIRPTNPPCPGGDYPEPKGGWLA